MDRAATIRYVYQRLLDPAFRQRLRGINAEGDHPIVVALQDDSIDTVVSQVRALGGVSNVVIPTLNGVLIVTVDAVSDEMASRVEPAARLRVL